MSQERDGEHKAWCELTEQQKDAVIPALLEALGLQVFVVSGRRCELVELRDAGGVEKGSYPVG